LLMVLPPLYEFVELFSRTDFPGDFLIHPLASHGDSSACLAQ